MNLFDIIIISLALSLSVFPTAMTSSVENCMSWARSIRVSLLYGLIKGGLLALGFWLCSTFRHLFGDSGLYITFAVFLILGIKMIFQSTKIELHERRFKLNNSVILFFSAIAVNMDGLIAGLAFAFNDINLSQTVIIIGVFTFLVTLTGTRCGKKVGNMAIASKIELAGGLILVGYSLFILLNKTGIIILN